jgi:hypothetical protein
LIVGTDISYHAERRTLHGWEVCLSDQVDEEGRPYRLDFYCGEERNYNLFAILADVKRFTNGGFEPIVPPRGFPTDSPAVGREALEPETYSSHNRTWLTLRELLEFPWYEKSIPFSVYVDAENFLHYRTDSRPQSASPSPLHGCRVVSNDEMERLITAGEDTSLKMTLISFGIPYAEFAGPFVTETLPLLQQLASPDDIRLILSFDS